MTPGAVPLKLHVRLHHLVNKAWLYKFVFLRWQLNVAIAYGTLAHWLRR